MTSLYRLLADARPAALPRALAEQLDRDPVRIYEHVRNTIAFEPYYGVRKGADQTLAESAGSDADQAALLVALLRESGIHARFVQGVAEMPATQVANWVGVDVATGESLEAVPDILASGGIPTTAVRANGQLVKLRFDHVWAEAHVPAEAYRGVDEQIGGRAWLPLDPSVKETRFIRPTIDLVGDVGPTVDAWVDQLQAQTRAVDDHSAIPPSPTAATDGLQRITEALDESGVDDETTLGDVFGGRELRTTAVTYLPASTPFRSLGVSGEHRAIPSSLHSSVQIAISGADPLAAPALDPDSPNDAGFSFRASTAELANKRITIAYVPASQQDAEIIDAYHGLLNAPTYAASLIPVLRVDGRVVARGHRAVSTGYTQNLALTYRMPGFASDRVENPLAVGSLSALALDLGFSTGKRLAEKAERWKTIAPGIEAGNLLTDRHLGEAFSLLG